VPYEHKGKGLNKYTGNTGRTEGYTSQDYASNLNEDTAKNLLGDNRFLKDLYDYYGQRDGKSFSTSDEAIEYYLNDRRWRNNNTISIGRDVYDAYSANDAQAMRLARIQQVYDALPFGVDGGLEAVAETGAAMLSDPLNLIGFGAGGQAARLAAGTAAKQAGKHITKGAITRQALGSAAKAGFVGEAVAGGITEGIADIGIQNRNVALGLQDDVSLLRAGGAALQGAAFSGAIGVPMGLAGAVAPTGLLGKARDGKIMGSVFDDKNARKAGKQGVAQLSREGLEQLSEKVGTNMDLNSIRRGMADAAVNRTGRVTPDGGLQLKPSVRGDLSETEATPDWGQAGEAEVMSGIEDKVKQELEEHRAAREEARQEGNTQEADRIEGEDIGAAQRKIDRINWINQWPRTREKLQAQANELTANLQAEGKTGSTPELDDLNKRIRNGDNAYGDFVAQSRTELQNGGSMAADRIDSILESPNELLDEAVQGEGFTVAPVATTGTGQRVSLDQDTRPGQQEQFRPQPQEQDAQTATPEPEQEAPTGGAQAEPEAPTTDERLAQINSRLDGRKKGSIAYERKRLEREMAQMPETLEDGTQNPERLTLQNRMDAIEQEAISLKEEQQSLATRQAEEAKQANDDILNENPEQPAQETVLAEDTAQPEAAQAQTTQAPEPVIDVNTQITDFIDNEFEPTLANIRFEFISLGMERPAVDAIIASLPRGKSKAATEARREVFRETVNIVRGQREWQGILNRSQGLTGAGDELFDETIADALIESTVGEALSEPTKNAHREWRKRGVARYAMDIENEFMGMATIDEMLEVVRNRHGEGGFYDMVAEFWANAQKGILPSPDDGMPQFVRQQIATLPKEMQVEWTAFREAAVRNLMKTGKLSEQSAKRLIATQMDAMLDRFLQMQAYQATDPLGNVYSTRMLATRGMRAIDIDEKAIKEGHGDHIGRVQHNLRNVTMGNGRPGSGRNISDKMVGRIQSFLREVPEGFSGRTFTTIRTVKDGKTFLYDASESARIQLDVSKLENNTSKARAFDEELRDRSIEAAQRAKDEGRTNVLDPRELEEVTKEIRLAEGAVARATKAYDQQIDDGINIDTPGYIEAVQRMEDNPDGPQDLLSDLEDQVLSKYSDKLDEANDRLKAALKRAKALTGSKGTDAETIKLDLKEKYEPLVYTDKATVVANKIEADRSSHVRRYAEVQARLRGINSDLRAAERQGNAEKAVALKKERAKLNKRAKEVMNLMTPADRKRLEADNATAAIQALGKLKRELYKARNADAQSKADIPQDELIRETEEIFNVNLSEEELSRAEYYANQEELASLAYQEMQGELAHLHEHSQGMPKEEVAASARQIVDNAKDKIQASKPDTRPKGEPEAHIVQIGKRAYNLAKDVQYQKISGDTTKFFVAGREMGSVKEFTSADGEKTYRITRRDGDKIVSDMASNRVELYKKLAQQLKKELDGVLSSNNVPEERGFASSPTEIPDYHNTQRYASVEDAPLQAQSSDPISVADTTKPQDRGVSQDMMPEGKLVAIQIIDPKHPDYGKNKGTRVINQTSKKGAPPQTSSSQIAGGLKPGQFVVGSVDSVNSNGGPVKSGTVAAVKTFRPLNPDDEFVGFSGQRMTGRQAGETEPLIAPENIDLPSSPRARENRATHVNELDNIELNMANVSPALTRNGMPATVRTAGDLQRFLADMEDVQWDRFENIDQFDTFTEALAAGYETLAMYAPNGVKLPNQKRSQSYKQLNEMLAGKDQREISEILSIFNMIAGSENRQGAMLESAMPVFDKAERYGFKQPGRHMAKDKQSNSILIGTSNKQTDAMNFAHEMAHWAYQNMMTPAERLEFWQIARGYVGTEGADIGALKKRLPGISKGEIRSPSEFFANQFAMYVANRRQMAQASLLTRLFQDIGRKAESLVRRLMGMDDTLDEKLVQMFDRIMPDPFDAADSVSSGRRMANQFDEILAKANGKGSSSARMAAQQLHDLRSIQLELEQVLLEGGAMGHDARILADVLERAAKKIYGKFGGRPGTRQHASRTDINGNVVEGGKRVTMLDSYDKGGNPLYDNSKAEITLPNGKVVKPFKYMDSRIARGRMLGMSYKIMRFLNDENFSNALSKLDASDLTDQEINAELARLIATQEDGGMMSIPDEVAAFASDNSGTLASSFDTEAAILRSISEKTDADGKLSALMVQQANDMIVALDLGIDEFIRIYNTNFRSTNGVAPSIDKVGRVYKSGNATTQKYVKRVEKKAQDMAIKVANSINDAVDTVFGNSTVADVDPPVTRNLKEMNNQEIMMRINDLKANDTPELRELKQELYHRINARPEDAAMELTPTTAVMVKRLMDIDLSDVGAKKKFLSDYFYKALDMGDYQLAENVVHMMVTYKQEAGVPVKSSLVGRALDIEAAQRSTPDMENGVPGDAPAAVKEVLTKLTHRDKRVEYTARTMMYRMLNMMGRTATELVRDKTTFMTTEDLFRLSGEPMPAGAKAGFAEAANLKGEPFNTTRKQLRQFAIGITNGSTDPIDIMHEIGHMVSRATFDDVDRDHMLKGFNEALKSNQPAAIEIQKRYSQIENYTDNDVAEEWFVEGWGQWMAEKVAKGNIYDIRFGNGDIGDLTVKNYLLELADRLWEYVAYVTNGLIRNKSVRQMYRQMLYHGDMFAGKRKVNPVKTLVNATQFPAVNPALAKPYARQVLSSMSNEKRLLLREYLGAGPDEDLADYIEYHGTPVMDQFDRVRNPDTYLIPSDDGLFGPGVYTTRNLDYAGGYAERTAPDAYRNMAKDLEGEKAEAAEAIIKQIEALQEKLEDAHWHAEGDAGYARVAHYSSKLEAATEAFARLTGNKKSPGVMPMFVRTKNHIDLRSSKRFDYGSGETSDVSSLLSSAQRRGYINQMQRQQIADFLETDGVDGDEFYEIMVNAMADSSADNFRFVKPELQPNGRKRFSQFLKDEGYEGIISNSSAGSQFEETITFDPNNMKHIEADFFDSDRRGMYYSVLGDEGTVGLAGDALQQMELRGQPINLDDMVGVARQLQEAGMPDLVAPVRRMLRKELPTASDVDAVKKSSTVFGYFRENSTKLREAGATWLGDYIKPQNGAGVYERHDVDLADKVMPIMNALKQLPDNKNWATRWSRRSLAFLPNRITGKVNLENMPPSHKRILGAIRRGEAEVRKLDAQEQRAARLIIAEFEAERQRMVALNIPVGDARRGPGSYYVPQQWDIELIRQNPSKAKKAFAQFFFEESRRPDFEANRLDAAEAHKKSEDFINSLMDSDGEVYGDDVLRRAVGDPFYNRVINLDPEQYDFMDAFLVNDLEGLLAKYFDSTTRKIALTDRFGVAGHGFSAYMNVAKEGVTGALKTLRSSKKVVYKYRQYQEEAPVEQMLVPALRLLDNEADNLMRSIQLALQDGARIDEAKRMLLAHYDPADQADPNLLIRVDAIINGLKDFPQGGIDTNTATLAERMMDILNKRPLKKFAENQFEYKVSRTVKAFNSVSLLAFTTLTSLGDLGMPLIRSGNFKAYSKAMTRYMSDPDYRAAAKNIGVGIENLLHDRMVQMAGEGSQKLQNSFFNFTLLTPWTNMNREIAGMVGFEAFKSEIARARKLAAAGQKQSPAYQTAERFLKRYGMTGEGASVDFLSENSPMLGDIKDTDMAANKQLRYALLRFTNETIFTPNPNDIPLFFQTPWGSMLFQLKSFQLMMARMGKYVIDEWKAGNRAPAAYLVTAGVGLGFASAASKDYVQSRGGEDNEQRALRERRISKSVFAPIASAVGVEDDSMTDEVLGNYLEGMMAIGGFGLFGELMYNTAEQADNGKYGFVRTVGAFLGPSVGVAEDAYDVFIAGPAGYMNDEEGKNARRREAVRSVVGRIPIAGGIRSFKEGVVDSVAGEAGTGGKKKKQASKFGGNSFSGGFGKDGF